LERTSHNQYIKNNSKNDPTDGLGYEDVNAIEEIPANGLPAYKSIYNYADQNTIFKDMEIGVIKFDKAYILTYEVGINCTYWPITQEMINSFQITK
jgi:hypothetical protein